MSRIPIRLPGLKSKYHAKREGKYASKKEAKRAAELAWMAKVGAITGLEEQVRFELIPKDELGRAIVYISDFVYWERDCSDVMAWVQVVEDTKGMRTPVYALKKRLMWRVHGIRIKET